MFVAVMATAKRLRPVFDAAKMIEDMAARGIDIVRLADLTGLHNVTIRRFLDGNIQTTKTATKIATALGYSPRRYLRGVEEAA